VSILGLDPTRAPAEVSAKASSPVWRGVLEPVVADWLERAAGADRQGLSTGAPQERAANTAIERLGDVPVISDSVFVMIAGAMLLLVALVGPLDYFVLRRKRLGHRSWITALFWIAAASAVAFGAPRIVRTAPTQVNRITVVDAMLGSGPLFQSGVTGVYAGRSGSMRLEGIAPTSWWRGRSVSYGTEEFRGLAVVTTTQRAAGGEAGSTRGAPLEQVPIALWTFRAFADDATGSPMWSSLTGRIHREGDGYRVTLAGLPKGVVVTEATLRIGGKWRTLTAPPPPPETPATTVYRRGVVQARPEPVLPVPVGSGAEGSWSGLFPDAFITEAPVRAWSNPPQENAGYGMWGYMGQALDLRPGPMLDLPGADRRGLGVAQRTTDDACGAVCLNLVRCPADLTPGWPAKTDHTAVLRLLIPLSEGDR
jgi:hypothetical protein